MASWPEIRETLEHLHGRRRVSRWSDDVLEVTVPVVDDRVGLTADGEDAHLERKVYVRRGEVPRKDGRRGLEFVSIDAPIGAVGGVDLMSAVAHAGQYDHCLLAYAQGDHGGALSVGTRLPAAQLVDAAEQYLGAWAPR